MLSVFLWIIEFINIVLNIKNICEASNISSQLENNIISSQINSSISDIKTASIINIIVSLIFCLAITIAYERSKNNKIDIENIEKFLQKKLNYQDDNDDENFTNKPS